MTHAKGDGLSIWKFSLDGFENAIEMPEGARLLSVAVQGDKPMLWALVDPSRFKVKRNVALVGTGWPLRESIRDRPFIGSVLLKEDSLVFHAFDFGESP